MLECAQAGVCHGRPRPASGRGCWTEANVPQLPVAFSLEEPAIGPGVGSDGVLEDRGWRSPRRLSVDRRAASRDGWREAISTTGSLGGLRFPAPPCDASCRLAQNVVDGSAVLVPSSGNAARKGTSDAQGGCARSVRSAAPAQGFRCERHMISKLGVDASQRGAGPLSVGGQWSGQGIFGSPSLAGTVTATRVTRQCCRASCRICDLSGRMRRCVCSQAIRRRLSKTPRSDCGQESTASQLAGGRSDDPFVTAFRHGWRHADL